MKSLQTTKDGPKEFAASFISFGVAFRLATNDGSLLQEMSRVVPYKSTLIPDDTSTIPFQLFHDQSTYSLQSGEVQLQIEAELPVILEKLQHDLMVHVANNAPDYVFVHAGVVGFGGRAIVFPGKSHAGKTTLVAELVKQGATYYSDEYAVIDADGLVHPYARQLQVREPGNPKQRPVTVESMGGVSGSNALPVAHVIFVQYVPGSSWSPIPITSGLAVLEMLRHSIPVQRTPARVMSVLNRMMAYASAWRTDRDDASNAAQAIGIMVGDETRT